jgi:hypothetical protein
MSNKRYVLTNLEKTRISITYGSNKKEEKVTKNRADSFVSFKVYEPVSGGLYKLKTQKVKDLSRVLTALGPHGVQITKDVEHNVKKDRGGDTSMKPKNGKETVQIRGFSSVLANSEIEEEVEEVKKEEPKKEAPKKIKKKKGKR